MFQCRMAETGRIPPFSAADEHWPEPANGSGQSLSVPGRHSVAPGTGQTRAFQNLRAMSMTKDERRRTAIPHQGARNLSSRTRFSPPRSQGTSNRSCREMARIGRFRHGIARAFESMRGVGCLWYRAQNQESVYCAGCETKLRDFPSPESRKRRGRPGRKPLIRVWAVADATGGTQ
jgi:hypothetical protein